MRKFLSCLLFLSCFSVTVFAKPQVILKGLPPNLHKKIQKGLENTFLEETGFEDEKPAQIEKDLIKFLKDSLEPFGYYAPYFKIQPSLQEKVAFVHVTLGKPTRIHSFSLDIIGEGKDDPEIKKAARAFSPQVGAILNHERYEKSKATLQRILNQAGYALGTYEKHQVLVDPENASAQIDLVLNTGPLFRVGPVSFAMPLFDPAFLKRFIPFEQEAPYHIGLVAALENTLSSSNYFEKVEVLPNYAPPKTLVPFQVRLHPKPPNQYLGGVGWTTDTGFRGRVEWKRRYCNQLGHAFNVGLLLSEKQQSMDVRYLIPGHHPNTQSYSIGFSESHIENQSDILERTQEEWSFLYLTNLPKWQRAVSFSLYNERSHERFDLPKTRKSVLLPTIKLSKQEKKDAFNPKRGHTISISFQGIMDRLGMTEHRLRTSIYAKHLQPLNSKTHLVFRGAFGAILPGSVQNVPISLRYFAGGDNSVRGFGYQSLRPSHPVEGGKFLTILSAQVLYQMKGHWELTSFVDSGNAHQQIKTSLYSSFGAGVGYRSPIGPIRLAYAKPIHIPKSDRNKYPGRIHFSLGPEF